MGWGRFAGVCHPPQTDDDEIGPSATGSSFAIECTGDLQTTTPIPRCPISDQLSSAVVLHNESRVLVAIAPLRQALCAASGMGNTPGMHSDAKATFPSTANNSAEPPPPDSGSMQRPPAACDCTIRVHPLEQLAGNHDPGARVPPGPRPGARLRAHLYLQSLQHTLVSPHLQAGISPRNRLDIMSRVQEPTSDQRPHEGRQA